MANHWTDFIFFILVFALGPVNFVNSSLLGIYSRTGNIGGMSSNCFSGVLGKLVVIEDIFENAPSDQDPILNIYFWTMRIVVARTQFLLVKNTLISAYHHTGICFYCVSTATPLRSWGYRGLVNCEHSKSLPLNLCQYSKSTAGTTKKGRLRHGKNAVKLPQDECSTAFSQTMTISVPENGKDTD